MNNYSFFFFFILSSQSFADTIIYEDYGSFGGLQADAGSISADGKVIGVRRLGTSGAFDKSYIITPGGIIDIGAVSGSNTTTLLAVSSNGLAAIGNSGFDNSEMRPFWWSSHTGIVDIGSLGGTTSYAIGVSADGNVVTGNSFISGNTANHSFRWSLQDGLTDLGTLGGELSNSNAISADGSTIVGYSNIDNSEIRAFRWQQETGMLSLGTLSGNYSVARGVSADGSVIVGASDTSTGQLRAFRWTADSGMVDIHPQDNDNYSIADLVSSDGAVVVGTAIFNSGFTEVFRWTSATGTVSLSSLGGGISHALAITKDGSAIVGYSYNANMETRAFRWTAGDGMQDLGTIGGANSVAWDVSDDGTVIAGTAQTAEGAAHAILWKFAKPNNEPEPEPEPGTGGKEPNEPSPGPGGHIPSVPPTGPQNPEPNPVMIDVDHTTQAVMGLGGLSFSAIEAQRLTLNKLQNFCDVERAAQTCYSLFTDVSGFGGQKDLLTGFTIGHGFTDNFSAGVTIAHSFWRDLPDGFDSGSDNFGGGIFAQWKDKTAIGDWYMRASLAANRYDTDITRPMFAYTEAGTGESRLQGWSTSLELGRTDNLNFHNARLGYYGGMRYSSLSMDGYTESNALFPFTYGDMKYELTTAYAGANFTMPLTDRIRWSINLEIEQDVAHKDPEFDARADYIGVLTLDSDFSHTRGSAWTSVSYAVSDAVELSLTPYVTRTASRDNAFGAMIRLSGKF
ncbi:autotransporter domain-containing protein [Brucella gallinifaecis]|uniref:autotransporter domain-containing protein n=1 Tax=Brucella gallinifaecis TaxID=215590 RepID=UPI00235F339A|nr:autotransporter domain-containing protein [Brucella gallinifaecis]